MRGHGWRWTEIGIWALLGAGCNIGGDELTDGDSGASDTADTTGAAPIAPTSTQGGATEPDETATGSASESGDTSGTTTGTQTGDTEPATTGETTDGESATTDEPGEEGVECLLAQMHLPCDGASDSPLHAIGLDCVSFGGQWGPSSAVAVQNFDMQAAPGMFGKRSWQVAESYGSFIDPDTAKPFWGPREGYKVLLISSGLLPPPDPNGAVIIEDGDVYNDVAFGDPWDSNAMPPPMQPGKGSPHAQGHVDCDGENDCSNTIWAQWQSGNGDAEDKLWFSFQVTAPSLANGQIADAHGYSFEFAYFSAEFPEYVGTEYNDIFVVWQASEDYTGNVLFIDGRPLTVTALWPVDFVGECDDEPGCSGHDEHLEGTGHITDGGATGWYKATGGVHPGETFTLTFSVFDMGDSYFDSTAILDNWAWDCEGCVANEVDSCGIAPQPM
ncbi:choice-of-anchor L domain-containing protein [Nannocystis radixulma]|uniref:Choice-of-anchor L domain-containing protein n=1 Tax=Nannocystis radixulma TaxID=2995305 RepID=A0ABT5BBX6_9BACT|nr:choice-of-anchor L domain-containing protein [Nannocystis radixulma]MDC0671577.1 choice-of-anchor L domain-containing protein [Nannocystis radixulma]